MSHTHDFDHQPEEEGFDGLGINAEQEIDADLAQTVYYMVHSCAEPNCPVTQYKDWLFEQDSFDICCEDLPEEETSLHLDGKLSDFRGPDRPIEVIFTCEHCGRHQKVESDHIYTTTS